MEPVQFTPGFGQRHHLIGDDVALLLADLSLRRPAQGIKLYGEPMRTEVLPRGGRDFRLAVWLGLKFHTSGFVGQGRASQSLLMLPLPITA